MTSLQSLAARYADAILDAIQREYPHGWRHHAAGPVSLRPREQHPAFYGCYDWHSAVHMHWSLVRLLRRAPDEVDAERARAVLDDHLTPGNLRAEVAHLAADPTWERPYGWGWALALADELADSDDADTDRWNRALEPLADTVTGRFLAWLPTMDRPVRAGMHLNSAFGLSLALPWARRRAAAGDPRLVEQITAAAGRWFAADTGYDNRWEPDAWDFLSPGLAEIDLMGEVLEPGPFREWLARFRPDPDPGAWTHPVGAGDRGDGQVAHLDGLNLHRAYALRRLADRLDGGVARVGTLREAADEHAGAGLAHVTGGDYMSEHWLASFAILVLDTAGGVAD